MIHEYFLIIIGLLMWEMLFMSFSSNYRVFGKAYWKAVYNGLVTPANGWMMSLFIGFDDEIGQAFFGMDQFRWWDYVLIGFFQDILFKIFKK